MRKILGFAALCLLVGAGTASATMMPIHLAPAAMVAAPVVPDAPAFDFELLSASKTTVCHKHTYEGNNERYVTINTKDTNVQNHLDHGDCYFTTTYPSGCDCSIVDGGDNICDNAPSC
ncbi:MAG TPA: hypothetical protein VI942_04960 [Thermoanaerobaculia bacterium]|nr:hypothetical protein [Thermoanaerobaculia bacterium]